MEQGSSDVFDALGFETETWYNLRER